MARNSATEYLIEEAQRALRAVDGSAFLVSSRVLRRVIKQDGELPGLGFYVPHRKSYVIPRERLLKFVAVDELGLTEDSPLPRNAILITRPDEDELSELGRPELLRQVWRLLFHARVHIAFDERFAAGELSLADIRARIDRIGQTEFDEIRAVLEQEHYLWTPADYKKIYTEFAAVYLELRHFVPDWLPTYFPSVDHFERIDEILTEDVDAARLLAETRIPGASDADILPLGLVEGVVGHVTSPREEGKRSEAVFRSLQRRAQFAGARGNAVRAAILYRRAVDRAPPDREADATAGVKSELAQLTARLQTALGFDDTEAADWREALAGLLDNSAYGFWNADAKLLSDLQKVCVDHERTVSVVDLVEWVRSLGRRPIIRPLPNQREVLMSKHLHSAANRLAAARLSGSERERLSDLLHAAAQSAEEQLRHRLRPLIAQVMAEVGLVSRNVPEQVAVQKLIEELLDGVVHRGYLTIGNLRDAISRNNLKLEDVSGPLELWEGDRLLQADRGMGVALDGVYHRGEFYLRWLQGLSSLAFGTRTGRFLTQYVAIPFGGAFVAMEGLNHLVSAVSKRFFDDPLDAMGPKLNIDLRVIGISRDIHIPWTVLGLGCFLLAMIHVPLFRTVFGQIVRKVYRIVRGVLVDVPLWLSRQPVVRAILRSTPFWWFRRFALTPLFVTGLIWLLLPLVGIRWERWREAPGWPIGVFLALNLLLNSRAGRDIEELTAEFLERTWYQIRVRVFVALFELIMDSFKWTLETIERVLYAVDEWLRFKSGESSVTLVLKAVLGVLWAVINFVIRFCVTLLIEPQVNPIKHFPVVTVSHKFLLPLALTTQKTVPSALASLLLLALPMSVERANTLAATVVWGIPGIFGFLVWELKENWRLYAANRAKNLKPVVVGEHGETLIRLMRPGLHSGTLPKLYGKLRRAGRKFDPVHREHARNKYHDKLQGIETSIRHFVERELLELLANTDSWRNLEVEVGQIDVASNSLRIELVCFQLGEHSLWLSFQEQSGRLIAGVQNSGWLRHGSAACMQTLSLALAGLYKIGGVDLVREQIDACFEPQVWPYDLTEEGLVVWPGTGYQHEITYNLAQQPQIVPRPRSIARSLNCPSLLCQSLLFQHFQISWDDWVRTWETEREGREIPVLMPTGVRLLPPVEQLPVAENKSRRERA